MLFVYTRVHMALICAQNWTFLCTQGHKMECFVHKSTRPILLCKLWEYSPSVLNILITL